jgi:hypothetical protein
MALVIVVSLSVCAAASQQLADANGGSLGQRGHDGHGPALIDR